MVHLGHDGEREKKEIDHEGIGNKGGNIWEESILKIRKYEGEGEGDMPATRKAEEKLNPVGATGSCLEHDRGKEKHKINPVDKIKVWFLG